MGDGVREPQVEWTEAWDRAQACLEGVSRRRIGGASQDVEIALLDWGGEGELAILHHANGFCAATLAPIAQRLSERYRVISIDARGHGDSTPVPPLLASVAAPSQRAADAGATPSAEGAAHPYAWETLARDLGEVVRSVLEQTGRSRVALGIGHSFGGALMLRAASRAPAQFERLVLCDPVILPPPPPETERGASTATAPGNGGALAAATRKRRDRFPSRAAAFEHCRSRGLFANFTPEALALYVGEGMRESGEGEIALKCDRQVEAAIFDGGGVGSMIDEIERVSAEVLFVHAQHGNFSLAYYEEIASKMPRARAVSVDAGHLFPLEEPERVFELIDADPR